MRGPWSAGATPRNRFTSMRSRARVSIRFSTSAMGAPLQGSGALSGWGLGGQGDAMGSQPIERTGHRFLPLAVARLPRGARHGGSPAGVLLPLAAQGVEIGPETHRQAGGVSGAEAGGLRHGGADDWHVQNIGLELHQQA